MAAQEDGAEGGVEALKVVLPSVCVVGAIIWVWTLMTV